MTAAPTPAEHAVEVAATVDRSDRHQYRVQTWWRCACMPADEWHKATSAEAALSAYHSHELLELLR